VLAVSRSIGARLAFVAGAAAAVAVTGCPGLGAGNVPLGGVLSEKAAGFAGPIEGIVAIEEYFPLKAFFRWTYAVTIVSGTATTSAQDVVRVETYSETDKSGKLSFKRIENGTTTLQATGDIKVSSSAITLTRDGLTEVVAIPLKEGLTWTSGRLTASSFKVPKLTVGATTYESLIGITYSLDNEVLGIRYLAPKVGVVRTLTRQKDAAKTYLITSDLQDSRTVALTSVSFSPTTTQTLTKGATAAVAASALREDGLSTRELTFSSSHPAVATIAAGSETSTGLGAVITAVGTGTATVSVVSDQDPTKLATLSVVVN
jgi:hypothetical protein